MNADTDALPEFIRERPAQPPASDLIMVDARVPLGDLIKALTEAGLTVINNRTGKLMVTYWPEDFRTALAEGRAE